MTETLITVLVSGFALSLYVWKLHNKAEFIVITRHREILKSLDMRGPERLRNVMGGDAKKLMFSIELDGEIIPYHKLYTKIDFIRSLNDEELIALCTRVKRLHRMSLCLIATPAVIFVLLGFFNS